MIPKTKLTKSMFKLVCVGVICFLCPNVYAEGPGPILTQVLTNPTNPVPEAERTEGWFDLMVDFVFGEMKATIRKELKDMKISEDAFERFYSASIAMDPNAFSIPETLKNIAGEYNRYVYKPNADQAVIVQKLMLLKKLKANPSSRVLMASEAYIENAVQTLIYSDTRSEDIPERKFISLFIDLNTGLNISISEDQVGDQQLVVLDVRLLLHQDKGGFAQNYELEPSFDDILKRVNTYFSEIEQSLSQQGINQISRRLSEFTFNLQGVEFMQRGAVGKQTFFAEGHAFLLFEAPSLSTDLVFIISNLLALPNINSLVAPKPLQVENIPLQNESNPNNCSGYLSAQ